jgi:hypothetical protein
MKTSGQNSSSTDFRSSLDVQELMPEIQEGVLVAFVYESPGVNGLD